MSMVPFILGGAAFGHRPIGLADAAVLEQQAEVRERLAVAAEHETAGGLAVEPVREFRAARQAVAQGVEPSSEARSRPSARDAPRGRPACRSPASGRRGGHTARIGTARSRVFGLKASRPFRVHAETAITAARRRTSLPRLRHSGSTGDP